MRSSYDIAVKSDGSAYVVITIHDVTDRAEAILLVDKLLAVAKEIKVNRQ